VDVLRAVRLANGYPPASAWTDSLQHDGTATDQVQAAELTGLN
jgi:hypothetical protein